VKCFGSNSFGQLGRGGDAGIPSYDPNPGNAGMLGMGSDLGKSTGSHQCALVSGAGQCWGRNHQGQVTGTPDVPVTSPVAVMGLMMAQEVAPGNTHTCALIQGGTVQCWGSNFHGQSGQMGAGDPEAGVAMPTNVGGLTNAISIASGWGDFSCSVVKGGDVWCWGSNFEGQLGRGGNAPQYDNTPKKVTFP
jgi:alpha-tubulin suppressor-like RCC1 family protein